MPWLSVNWDVWRVDDSAMDSVLGTTLKDLGMSAAEATAMMETVLALRSASQLVVSTGDLGARIDQWIKLESLNTRGSGALPGPNPSGLAQRPRLKTSFDAPRDETEQLVARIWQDALGIESIGINDNFFDLGGHSLIAVRIVLQLRAATGRDVPLRVLFECQTVAALAEAIVALAWLESSVQRPAQAGKRVEFEL